VDPRFSRESCGVGQTYYFTWLDGQFAKLEKNVDSNAAGSKVWMVHSGGFYSVEKQKSLGIAPEQVRWFRWEALMTWVAGVILLVLVYYLGDGLIDPDVADISKQAGLPSELVRSWQVGLSTILLRGHHWENRRPRSRHLVWS